MTTITFKEASILSHIAKQKNLKISKRMLRYLGNESTLVANIMIDNMAKRNNTRNKIIANSNRVVADFINGVFYNKIQELSKPSKYNNNVFKIQKMHIFQHLYQ
jgi:hypothetical protein